jgi:hypothetical protein
MASTFRKTAIISIASLAICLTAVVASTPALAFRMGGGGFHGGGFHGGFRGGGFGLGLGLGALGAAAPMAGAGAMAIPTDTATPTDMDTTIPLCLQQLQWLCGRGLHERASRL